MQARHHGSDRDAQDLRDGPVGHSFEFAEDDHHTKPDRESQLVPEDQQLEPEAGVRSCPITPTIRRRDSQLSP